MVSKNLCRFITTNGRACKCYKMKDAEFCKSHNNQNWGSDIEYVSDSDNDSKSYNTILNTSTNTSYNTTSDNNSSDNNTSDNTSDNNTSDNNTSERLEELQNAYEKIAKDVTIMKAKIQRTNFIQMIIYTYLLSVFLYNNVQFEDVRLIVNDLTHCANVFATYTMDVVKHTQSFIENYSVYNYNYTVCSM